MFGFYFVLRLGVRGFFFLVIRKLDLYLFDLVFLEVVLVIVIFLVVEFRKYFSFGFVRFSLVRGDWFGIISFCFGN